MGQLSFRETLSIQRVLSGREKGYHYATELKTIPANADDIATAQVEMGWSFTMETITGIAIVATTNRRVDFAFLPQPRVVLIDQGSGARFMNRDDNTLDNIFGDAEYPYRVRPSKTFIPGSTIAVRVFNIANVDYEVQFAFHGCKYRSRGVS